MHIVRTAIGRSELAAIAAAQFGDMVKAVVDVARGVMAVGAERRVVHALVTDQ